MLKFVLKRLGYGLLVLLGVILVVFFLFHALPGDPVSMLAGQRTDIATREEISRELGLNRPLPVQLAMYLNDISPLSIHEATQANSKKYNYNVIAEVGEKAFVFKSPYLRRSFQTNRRVDEIIFDTISSTFWLAFSAMLVASVFGILFGFLAALRVNSFWDHLLISSSVIGISVPSFVSAILIAMVFGYYLSDFTGLNMTGQLWVNHPVYGRQLQLQNLILPALTLSIRPVSIIAQLTRSAMIDVFNQDYIRTAKAKGLKKNVIIIKHALKNALNPVITAVSGWMAALMTGAFFVEYIFDWKGLGFVTIRAVQNLDFPVVMGATLVIAIIFVIINIIADILYAAIDPRVRVR
jgi:ABC-type dipeptide/oligopeptide/nickel transport system permease component